MTAALLNFPTQAGTAQPYASTPQEPEKDNDDDYLPIERLRRQYYDYLGAADAEIAEQRESRRYFHGSQWTAAEIETLKKRKQPVYTNNVIARKLNAIVGLVEKLRQDPKAYPRTPQHEQGAELATATLRFVLDDNDWKSKSSRISRNGAIDGIAGIEYDLQPGDKGDPNLALHIVYGDGYFYDKRSFDEGFTDARYCGVAKWIDVEQAKELVPSKAAEIDDLIESGSDLTTAADIDKEKVWINSNEKRVRLVDHWFIKGGKWRWCLYIANTQLMRGVSPFIDENGKTFSRYRMFSASVDQDGDRYGFVRNLKSQQDGINHRESKALHNLNSRRIITPKGALDNIEAARKEAARPDGVLEYNPMGGAKPEFDDARQLADMHGQLEMLKEAKANVENFGPNPALVGQGLEDSSGRAINLLQQAGMAELGPYLSAYRNWKIRVYRDIWNIIQRSWTAERWIRVTDDQNVAQFFQINKLAVDPTTGQPAIVNAIGSLDVDIIIDEGPDAINMQADNYMVLQSLGPQFAQEFPEIALELAPLASSVKKPMLDKIKQKQSQPPRPDPKVMSAQQMAQLEQQKAVAEFQQEQQRAAADMQLKQQTAATDLDLERMKIAAQIQLEREKAAAHVEIEHMKASAKVEIDRSNHAHDMQMSREKVESEGAAKADAQHKQMETAPVIQAITSELQGLASGLTHVLQEISAIAEDQRAPAELVRDAKGKPTHVRKGSRQMAIKRGPDGRAMGLE